jgi:hypothetical protein
MLQNKLLDIAHSLSRGLTEFGWILVLIGLGFAVALVGDPLREENPRVASNGDVDR